MLRRYLRVAQTFHCFITSRVMKVSLGRNVLNNVACGRLVGNVVGDRFFIIFVFRAERMLRTTVNARHCYLRIREKMIAIRS